MDVRKHFQLLAYSFITWFTFYLVGLPEYYQQWYFWAKVLVCLGVTVAYCPITAYTLRTYFADGNPVINACWLALYLTLPLFVYDYLLLGLYKGLGIGFVIPYWYLSFFYFSFWLQFPLVAWWMQRNEASDSSIA